MTRGARRLQVRGGLAAVLVWAAVAALLGACTAAAPGDARTTALELVDVTDAAGLDFTHGAFRWGASADPAAMMGGGACWLDADGDGWLDLYLVNSWSEDEHPRWMAEGGLPRSTLFRNDEGAFTDVGAETGSELTVRGQGCMAADLDADGWTDLYVTTARTSVLLWNDGDGTFTPDGGAAGLDVYGWRSAAVAGDVDGDGWLDVFIGGYVDVNARLPDAMQGFPRTHAPVRDLLLRSAGPGPDGRVSFTDVSADAGIDADGARYTLGATFGDVDGDGDLDLLVANDTDPNRLYRNDSADGRITLTDVAAPAGADDDNSGMGIATGDVDGDGAEDLLVTNMGEQRHTLLANRSTAAGMTFTDLRADFGVGALGEGLTGWGTSLVDLDRDTHLDVLVVNGAIPVTDVAADAQPLLAYRQDGGRLVDATAAWGLDDVRAVIGRGSAVADHDNDGDADVVIVGLGGRAVLLESRGGTGHWLQVDPAGRVPGTRVTATLPSGRVLVDEVRAGSSYLSTEDPRVLMGLGDAERIARLEVVWPDGSVAVHDDVAADQLLVVTPTGARGRAAEPQRAADPERSTGPVAPAAAVRDGSPAVDCGDGGDDPRSVARRWVDVALGAIRRDLPAPTVHARNLHHLAVAMWDAWAAYDPDLHGIMTDLAATADADEVAAAREASIARAAHDVLAARYADAHGAEASLAAIDRALADECLSSADAAVALGATAADGVLAATAGDGSDPGPDRTPRNPPLVVAEPGTTTIDPDRWQPLALEAMVTQNGIPLEETVQTYLGWRWGQVTPYALPDAGWRSLDPGPPPRTDDPDGGAALRADVIEVLRASSRLDPRDGVLVDVSPASIGGSTLGTDDGTGHAADPVTGRPYDAVLVPRADHQRVIAEYWADGPTSETPPGHWTALAGEVTDAIPAQARRIGGRGPVVDPLEWDVALYLAVSGAMHDAAIAAWGIKAEHDSARPISLIRWMGSRGQSSDPDGPAYDPAGLPLVDDLTEVITEETSAPGQRHDGLADHIGEVAVRAWTPTVATVGDPALRVRWIPASRWVPYQRSTFVTPAFAGYVSGHSTFSRAAAEVLTAFTGSPWFPGGLHTTTVPAGGLVFEDGPTIDVPLQWASYADAADQAGRSRIAGGIHIPADDLAGRRVGAEVGRLAWERTSRILAGEE